MRREVLATIFLTACSFDHGSAADPRDGGPPPYSTPGDGSATTTPPPPPPPTTCHSSVPGIVLCLDFEPPNLTKDTSGFSHSVQAQNVSQTMRAGQGAASLGSSSSIYVQDRADLDIAQPMTIEMWISPHSIPQSSDQTWMVASTDQYGFGLDPSGIVCGVSPPPNVEQQTAFVNGGTGIPLNQWSHVACVYDGAMLAVYVNGVAQGCTHASLTINTTTKAGLDIGAGFDGGLDDVHLYAAALTDDDICRLATGGTNCKLGCR